MKHTDFSFVFIFFLVFALISGCGTEYQPSEEDKEDQEPQEETNLPTTDAVAADANLDAVTWNLLGYGTGFTGPSDTLQQTKNIISVIDSLDADLYAFQEVAGQRDLDKIVDQMKEFKGFVTDFVPRSQKMAVAYNTNTIDSLEAGSIKNVANISNNDWSYYWASGRIPLYFRFNYTFGNTTKEFYAVVIHGKASAEYEAYQRRKKAAEGLYTYLQNNKPDANIILLGDYNDDVDKSIYSSEDQNGNEVYQQTPYYNFVNDTQNFEVITKKFSDTDESASVNYSDIVDHITMSDELSNLYVDNSTDIYKEPQSFITNYGTTTSDHLPVSAAFDITASN
ncbi:Endonuclease/Exonuclease/phosphatase family protein [Fodinibius salinus]|uniref:Endonuclease/Exonuclease/phosphatase family protein n=1 Tax=Fodinibius salinus TaxID=860790 RepID=A0A5D3YPB8_9BACT|nr:endonuclease/exonuclease/phosphatase family protein [Fodinibius salinus]TYP95552.1 Endonuclease/Exonuclease/phosphatase family protein [Fodinibius salinus]